MWTKFSECDCTMECDAKGIRGKPTKMEYKGNGKFICPKCKKEEDYSEYTFKIQVCVEITDNTKMLRVFDGEERIFKHWHDDKSYCVIKDCIDEDLGEYSDEFYDDWLDKHDTGIYELDIYYEPYSIATQEGTMHELATEIFKEKKLEVVS